MGTPTIGEIAMAQKGGPVIWRGLTVHLAYFIPIEEPSEVKITAVSIKQPDQGITVDVRNGTLLHNGRREKGFRFMMSSARWEYEPEVLQATHVRKPTELILWNVWRGASGSIDSWLCNCGMLVDEHSKGDLRRFLFRCSPGRGPEPDFEALVFLAEVRPLVQPMPRRLRTETKS